MNFHDPESMADVIGNVLRYGVVASAAIIMLGVVLLVASTGTSGIDQAIVYNPSQVPHGDFGVSLDVILTGLATLQPYAIIQLGVIVLLATPVSRVLISVFLFAAEHDLTYVYITLVVLGFLLFSILLTPLIPLFQG